MNGKPLCNGHCCLKVVGIIERLCEYDMEGAQANMARLFSQVKLLRMKGLTKNTILHKFGTLYGTMCGGDLDWEEADFSDAPVDFLDKVFHVTIVGDNAEVAQGNSGNILTTSRPTYENTEFEKVMGDTLKANEHFADIQGIYMKKLLSL